ncbi:transposase [Tamlana crocina]
MYEQQSSYFKTGQKIKDRIVSISKDYLRPIVRGKETKPVEFGAKVNKLQIYGTNKNRSFVTKHQIKTDFKRKGKLPKDHQGGNRLKAAITKERASRLEGSFGKEKEHCHLKEIKAKTKPNEMLWVFFGIHTANALEMGRRMQNAPKQVA